MRASEALLLGSVLLKPKGGALFSEPGAGCALGMILVAEHGLDGLDMFRNRPLGYCDLPKWLEEPLTSAFLPPCGCWREPLFYPGLADHSIAGVIIHLFDFHVMGDKKDWTIEQLADWLRSVEPTEELEVAPETQPIMEESDVAKS